MYVKFYMTELSEKIKIRNYLDEFKRPWGMIDKFGIVDLCTDTVFKFWITLFVKVDSWEQIVNQRQEERLVLVYKFGQVHIT